MLLGEANSKVQHIAGSLLRPDRAHEMNAVYLAKGVLGTTAIEGNTLSEEEVRGLVEGDLELPPSQEYLRQATDNIIAAYNRIKDDLLAGVSLPLDPAVLADYNCAVLRDLPLEDGVVPGKIPEHSVVVGRYRAAPREDCLHLLETLCDWLNSGDFTPPSQDWIVPMALIKSVVAHIYIAWIHPFGDGNGRTARMVELRILMEAGVPMPAAHLLSNYYNLTREQYYRELDAASRESRGAIGFLEYAVRGFVDGLCDQLKIVRDQQFADRWEQYIYEQFSGRDAAPDRRRRALALGISEATEPVRPTDMRRLSPKLAEEYAGKAERTVYRDVEALLEMNLIEKVEGGFSPAKGQLLGFLPLAAVELPVAPTYPV
ncbi:MAG TPA: Fic family protein [Solirubrobacterales bacterium]|nr:Fic family protein [Solirubrobacterales bacterium]